MKYILITILFILSTTTLIHAVPAATGSANPTTEQRVTQLEAELLALTKENNLLTDTLKNNWVAFKGQCGAVLTKNCAEVSKESEKFVDDVEKKEACIREKGEDDESCFEHMKKHGPPKGHEEERENDEEEPERRLRGDDDDKEHRRGGRHGDKHKKGGKHGGKHHHRGGKGPEQHKPPPVVESVKCVMKQSFKDEKSVPAHCVHSAKRFGMFLKLHHPSKVVVMMPPRHGRHINGMGVFGLVFNIFFLALVMTCCVKCVRRLRKKRCPVAQQQTVAQPQIVLGQPVVIAATAPAKI